MEGKKDQSQGRGEMAEEEERVVSQIFGFYSLNDKNNDQTGNTDRHSERQ
jgi:hypothetical protein